MTTLATLDRREISRYEPPKKARPFGDFAHAVRLPDGPSGPRDGRPGDLWFPETEPTQIQFIRQVESGRWNIYVITAPSQRGKTLKAILSPTLYHITERREAVAYVLPSLDLLEKNWSGKLKPAVEGTGFGAWLPTKGPGSKGGRPAVISLRDPSTNLIAARWYFMAMGKGGNEGSTASVTAQHIMIDEADDAVDAGQLKRTCKRIESWKGEGSAYIASTVNDRTGRESPDANDPSAAHPILVFYAQGSRHRLHHRCPHCSEYFAPELEHIDLDRCAITCPKCAVVWSEADRKDALNRSLMAGHLDRIVDDRVIPGEYDHRIYSELTTGLDYHMGDLRAIVDDIKQAKAAELRGDHSLMRNVMHKIFCRPYVEPIADGKYNEKALVANSGRSTYEKRMVPAWATFLTMAQDVQGDRHYWEVIAHGPDDRWAVVDWGYELLVEFGADGKPVRAPTPADRVRVFDLIRDKATEGWQIQGGEQRMRPVQRGVDCGYVPDEVVAWCQGNPSWKVVRGVGKDQIKHQPGGHEKTLPKEIRQTKALQAVRPPGWRVYWWRVDGHRFRRAFQSALLRDPDQAASGMLPRGLKENSDLVLHLTGEIWMEPDDGEPYWFEKRKRHDYGDCTIYNLALALLHRFAPDDRDGTVPVAESAPAEQASPTGDGSWIQSSFDAPGGSWING